MVGQNLEAAGRVHRSSVGGTGPYLVEPLAGVRPGPTKDLAGRTEVECGHPVEDEHRHLMGWWGGISEP